MFKILLFRVHQGDPLSWVIKETTWENYTHAAGLVDEATNTIIEAYYPHVRRRQLLDSELDGIDVFTLKDATPEQLQGIVDWLAKAVTTDAGYSIANLFRFVPPFRAVLGDPPDPTQPSASEFCSQLQFSACLYGGKIRLLNTESYKVDPGHLGWSTLLVPAEQLKPMKISPQMTSP